MKITNLTLTLMKVIQKQRHECVVLLYVFMTVVSDEKNNKKR